MFFHISSSKQRKANEKNNENQQINGAPNDRRRVQIYWGKKKRCDSEMYHVFGGRTRSRVKNVGKEKSGICITKSNTSIFL